MQTEASPLQKTRDNKYTVIQLHGTFKQKIMLVHSNIVHSNMSL